MAGAVAKTFGVLLLLIGVTLLLGGIGAAVYAQMDEQEHKEEQGPFGMGRDEEREQINQALLTGGIVAASLGFLLVVVGIVLMLVRGRESQGQQQIVTAGGAATSTSLAAGAGRDDGEIRPEPGRAKLAAGIIVGVVLLGLLVFAGVTGSNPLGGGLFSSPPPPLIQTDHHTANMGPSLHGGVSPVYGGQQAEFLAPEGTRSLVASYEWGPFTGGADNLRLIVSIDAGEGYQIVTDQVIASGDIVVIDGGDGVPSEWSGVSVRMRIEPADPGIYQGQPFEGTLQWMR